MLACTAAWPASASAIAGGRVKVALFGDSVTQGIVIPDFEQHGLAPDLASDVARSDGLTAGGEGLVPAEQYQWNFNAWTLSGHGTLPANGWLLQGTAQGSYLSPGYDGPSGYSAITTSALATATTTVNQASVQVLFNSTPAHCLFAVTAAGSTWVIDSYRAGPMSAAAQTITLPAGSHTLTVHGPSCGFLSFDGVVEQAPVAAHTQQVEVDNLGHAATLPFIDLQPRVEQAIALQHYNVTVLLFGYLGVLYSPSGTPAKEYQSAMLVRADLARSNGGNCVIVAPAPLAAPASAVAAIAKIDAGVARQAGCTYTKALAHVWPSVSYAITHNLVVVDGIHPTAKGYTLMARALTPVIAPLVKAQAQR